MDKKFIIDGTTKQIELYVKTINKICMIEFPSGKKYKGLFDFSDSSNCMIGVPRRLQVFGCCTEITSVIQLCDDAMSEGDGQLADIIVQTRIDIIDNDKLYETFMGWFGSREDIMDHIDFIVSSDGIEALRYIMEQEVVIRASCYNRSYYNETDPNDHLNVKFVGIVDDSSHVTFNTFTIGRDDNVIVSVLEEYIPTGIISYSSMKRNFIFDLSYRDSATVFTPSKTQIFFSEKYTQDEDSRMETSDIPATHFGVVQKYLVEDTGDSLELSGVRRDALSLLDAVDTLGDMYEVFVFGEYLNNEHIIPRTGIYGMNETDDVISLVKAYSRVTDENVIYVDDDFSKTFSGTVFRKFKHGEEISIM